MNHLWSSSSLFYQFINENQNKTLYQIYYKIKKAWYCTLSIPRPILSVLIGSFALDCPA